MWQRLSTRLSCLKIVCTSIWHRKKQLQQFKDALGIIRNHHFFPKEAHWYVFFKRILMTEVLHLPCSSITWMAWAMMLLDNADNKIDGCNCKQKSNQQEVTWTHGIFSIQPTNHITNNQTTKQTNKQTNNSKQQSCGFFSQGCNQKVCPKSHPTKGLGI